MMEFALMTHVKQHITSPLTHTAALTKRQRLFLSPPHTKSSRERTAGSALPKRHNPTAARWLTAIKKSDDRRQKANKNE